MKVLRAADHRRMPWKNGGGETAEIAIFPEGASLDNFLWRISMAHVASEGPFSHFPGINRSLAIIAGTGITLALADREKRDLTPDAEPLAFPGDIDAEASLIDGPVTDFNVMTRRGAFSHRMRRIMVTQPVRLPVLGEPVLLLCTGGTLQIEATTGHAQLTEGDCLLHEAALIDMIALTGSGQGYCVELRSQT